MTLGGLSEGVTPLDMAHAYETLARARPVHLRHDEPGRRRPQGARDPRPRPGRHPQDRQARRRQDQADQAPDGEKAENETRRLAGAEAVGRRPGRLDPVDGRHAPAPAMRAQIPGTFVAGKTGTTENYGDAWFVGWTEGAHGRGLGRLPGRAAADADRVQRRARGRRHLPRRDLEVVRGDGARTYEGYAQGGRGGAEDAPIAAGPSPRDARHAAPDAEAPGARADQTAPERRGRRRPPTHAPEDAGARRAAGAGGAARRATQQPPAQQAAVRRRAAAPRRRPRVARPAAARSPAGHGRETLRDPAGAEAPRQLRRLRDPDPRAGDERRRPPSRAGAGRCRIGPRDEVGAVVLELDRERLA